jgi:phage terminase large subunit GpA-like protein
MRRALKNRIAAAWKPDFKDSPDAWITRCVALDATYEAGAGRMDYSNRPWWADVVKDIADPEVRVISILGSTQIGKTINLEALLLYLAENDPAPAMIVVPDQDSAFEFRDRLYANAKKTIARGLTKRLKIPPLHKWNGRYISLGSMRVYLAWSGSRQRLRGRPCKYVFCTETDAYKGNKKTGDPIAAAHQRTKAFFRGLHYHESSPSPPSEIALLESQASARYRWHCECPHCGLLQEVRFFTRQLGAQQETGSKQETGGISGYRNAHGEFLSPEEARKQAYYSCEIGCKIYNEMKQRFLVKGEWKTLDGEPPASRRSIGRHLWTIHSETLSFGDIAASYVSAAAEGKIAEWWGNWLGLEYKPQKKMATWHELGRRAAGSHPRLTVPKEAWFLTAGQDVQGENNGVRYVIRAWGPERTSWLVDWGWIDRDPGDENELVKSDMRKSQQLILERSFPVHGGVNPLGRSSLSVRLHLCDSNYLPFKVHHWMRSLPPEWIEREEGRVRAIRGDHTVKPDLRWRPNVVEKNSRTGEAYEGGLLQWGIFVYPFYDELLERLTGPTGRPGSFYVTSDCLTQGKILLGASDELRP